MIQLDVQLCIRHISSDDLEAEAYLCDVGKERQDDGEVDVVGRGHHVDLVRSHWAGGGRGPEGQFICSIKIKKILVVLS